jgi:hypothetical protein
MASGRRNGRTSRLDHLARTDICQHPAFAKSGEFFRIHATGTGRERYKLRAGIEPQVVRFDNLFYADIAKASYAVFKRLKDAGSISADTKFRVDLVRHRHQAAA